MHKIFADWLKLNETMGNVWTHGLRNVRVEQCPPARSRAQRRSKLRNGGSEHNTNLERHGSHPAKCFSPPQFVELNVNQLPTRGNAHKQSAQMCLVGVTCVGLSEVVIWTPSRSSHKPKGQHDAEDVHAHLGVLCLGTVVYHVV